MLNLGSIGIAAQVNDLVLVLSIFPGLGLLDRQGLPADFALPLLSARGRQEAVGNGVPIPVGRAIAQAVKKALVSA